MKKLTEIIFRVEDAIEGWRKLQEESSRDGHSVATMNNLDRINK